jgi:hypothetical protein
MAETNYNEIRGSLTTGDIVLFSGNGRISTGIKWMAKSDWSHVGMVLILQEWNMVLLWESTKLDNIKDVIDGKAKKGVQLVALSDRISTYNGKVAVRRLKVDGKEGMKKPLMKFREEVKNKPYERDMIELLKSAYDGPMGENVEDLSSLFCSELVAEAYQRMDLLHGPPRGPQSNEYTPREFSSENKELGLLKEATLGDEIFIKKGSAG